MIASPWVELPTSAPFLIASDAAAIDAFNRAAKPDHRLHTELLPEPYFGRRDAPVVLLALNPGFSDADPEVHARPAFLAACRANLAHAPSAYPFVYLDPRFADTPGGAWWRAKLAPIMAAGVAPPRLAANLLCVEWFPYHSRAFRAPPGGLASQAYGFQLVAEAIARDALVIALRSSRLWERSVPALHTHPRRAQLRNPRNVILSAGNYDGDFAELVARLAGIGA